jgi:hypothetical protein
LKNIISFVLFFYLILFFHKHSLLTIESQKLILGYF